MPAVILKCNYIYNPLILCIQQNSLKNNNGRHCNIASPLNVGFYLYKIDLHSFLLSTPMTKFSVIVPTFNSARYIKECLNSILQQTVKDFTVHIVDSGSTEAGFLDWIRSLNDDRIVIYTAERRYSIEENWQRITALPKNEFMTIIGHDDVLAPHYLEEMASLIEANNDASLYLTAYTYIDKDSRSIRESLPLPAKMSGELFIEYFLDNKIEINATGYMMRSKDYEAAGGIPNYPNLLNSDSELWIRLTLKSYLAVSSRNSFSFREHASVSGTSADIVYHNALKQFVDFLLQIKQQYPALQEVITIHSQGYLLAYCLDFSHRLIRKRLKDRHYLTVNRLVKDCTLLANKLSPSTSFQPLKLKSLLIAKWIDSNIVTRTYFRLLRKFYSGPLIKRPETFL